MIQPSCSSLIAANSAIVSRSLGHPSARLTRIKLDRLKQRQGIPESRKSKIGVDQGAGDIAL